MLSKVRSVLEELGITPNSAVLAGVSGGVDSVVMAHVLHALGYKIGIAHVNFQLRGEESERDRFFVENVARELGVRFYCTAFDTIRQAKALKISLQMAARQLRYDYFDLTAKQNGFAYIATAHHLDDSIETFFINLLRGTGIAGLKGIPKQTRNIIRPLIRSTRAEIETYAAENKLQFVDDSSNLSPGYLRNKLRLQVLPFLQEIKPGFTETMASNLEQLSDAEAFYQEAIQRIIRSCLETRDNEHWINLPRLNETGFPSLVLHEILHPFGFNPATTRRIASMLPGQSGKRFLSETHEAFFYRKHLIVKNLTNQEPEATTYTVTPETTELNQPLEMVFERFEHTGQFSPQPDARIAFLDYSRLRFPLIIRRWKHGDRFRPLGMAGTVKLSDFFISRSFTLSQKKDTWLLTDATGRIIWVIGYRIGDDVKVTVNTSQIYKVSLK